MDYLFQRVLDAEFPADTPLRQAFAAHLKKVAEALHDIEWADSGDIAKGEEDASILNCLGLKSSGEVPA
jgi:hypothetical protein